MNAKQAESNFAYEHPALVATVITLLIAGTFLGAVWSSAKGHHGGAHGAAGSASASGHPAASAPKPATSAK